MYVCIRTEWTKSGETTCETSRVGKCHLSQICHWAMCTNPHLLSRVGSACAKVCTYDVQITDTPTYIVTPKNFVQVPIWRCKAYTL